MSVYTVSTLFEQLSDMPRSRLQVPRGTSKREKYEEIWAAINRWMEYRLSTGRGASIANFATWTWEERSVFRNSKEGYLRRRIPFFQVYDSFNRSWGLSLNGGRRPPRLARTEELNAVKIAIKYSESLTKDMVFAGLRDIFAIIGRSISQGYRVAIEFNIGTLHAERRKIKFEYEPQLVAQLNAPRRTGYVQMSGGGLGDGLLESVPETCKVKDDNNNYENENEKDSSTEHEEEEGGEDPQDIQVANANKQEEDGVKSINLDSNRGLNGVDSSNCNYKLKQSVNKKHNYTRRADITLLPSESYYESNDNFGNGLLMEENAVIEDAYRRHLQNVKETVENTAYEQRQFFENLQRLDREEKMKQDRRKRNNIETQTFIQNQMREKQEIAARIASYRPKIGQDEHCSFPPLVLSVANNNVKEDEDYLKTIISRQNKFRETLQAQIQEKTGAYEENRQARLKDERQFLEHVRNQTQTHQRRMLNRKLAVKQRLLQSWDRDKRLKQLLKQGIRLKQGWSGDEFEKKVSKLKLPIVDRGRPKSSRSEMSHFSVGFDQRL